MEQHGQHMQSKPRDQQLIAHRFVVPSSPRDKAARYPGVKRAGERYFVIGHHARGNLQGQQQQDSANRPSPQGVVSELRAVDAALHVANISEG